MKTWTQGIVGCHNGLSLVVSSNDSANVGARWLGNGKDSSKNGLEKGISHQLNYRNLSCDDRLPTSIYTAATSCFFAASTMVLVVKPKCS